VVAAVTVAACGAWDAVAAAIGPLASPLPQALTIGALVLAVPWWANRRRRAKVRVETGRLARAGGGHEVDADHPRAGEVPPVGHGHAVVLGQDALQDLHPRTGGNAGQ